MKVTVLDRELHDAKVLAVRRRDRRDDFGENAPPTNVCDVINQPQRRVLGLIGLQSHAPSMWNARALADALPARALSRSSPRTEGEAALFRFAVRSSSHLGWANIRYGSIVFKSFVGATRIEGSVNGLREFGSR